ncbi:hypothetical protein JNL27_13735 [bacterium]|nr:hypothetical protein [bacterium]
MRNKLYGPEVPVNPVMTKAEPAPEKKLPKRPISGYGPSLPLKIFPLHKK